MTITGMLEITRDNLELKTPDMPKSYTLLSLDGEPELTIRRITNNLLHLSEITDGCGDTYWNDPVSILYQEEK